MLPHNNWPNLQIFIGKIWRIFIMKINQVIYLGFGAIFLWVGISSIGSEWQQRNQAQSFELVVRTYEIKLNLQDIQKALVDAETAQRGFIITGDEEFLEPYYSAKRQIQSDLDSLSKWLQVNPIPTQRLTNIQSLTNQKLASLKQGINLARAGESEQVLALRVSENELWMIFALKLIG